MARTQTKHSTTNVIRKITPQSSAGAQPGTGGAATAITLEERYRMIAEAAYFRAERRGFAAGGELDDWVRAESEIDRLMQAGGSHAARAVRVA